MCFEVSKLYIKFCLDEGGNYFLFDLARIQFLASLIIILSLYNTILIIIR